MYGEQTLNRAHHNIIIYDILLPLCLNNHVVEKDQWQQSAASACGSGSAAVHELERGGGSGLDGEPGVPAVPGTSVSIIYGYTASCY